MLFAQFQHFKSTQFLLQSLGTQSMSNKIIWPADDFIYGVRIDTIYGKMYFQLR